MKELFAVFERRRGRLAALAMLALLISGHPLATQALDASDSGEKSGQVDKLFSSFTEGVQPGAAVMVIHDGVIVHSRGYGYADLEKKIPITPASAFRLASVSKQFTAMAIAILADNGKLDYSDPVGKYVPALSVYKGVTIRHLLTHTSGLPDYYDEFDASAWVEKGSLPSNADVMAYEGLINRPLFPPGEKYEYSNPAYEALPLIVEAVSGQDFASFMKARVFEPIGMSASLIHDHHRPHIDQRVLGYTQVPGGYELDDDSPLNGITGSGGQYSSLEDFYHWDQALYGDALVSEDTMKQVFTRARLNNGEEIDYGFGWRLDRYKGHNRIAHGGSWIGFRTAISRYPELGLSIVVLSNLAEYDPSAAADKIADIYLDPVIPATSDQQGQDGRGDSVHAPRARDLGIQFEGRSGPLNAITDVAGVTVGHTTLIADTDDGHAIRTGVTAILPRGKDSLMEPVMAATFALNGNGEMTGIAWVEESGLLEGPVMLTNTHSVGIVRDATIAWRIRAAGPDASGYTWSLPLVAETWDGHLNDINGFHVQAKDTEAALQSARGGVVAEGNVGGGTGMICHEYKCGIGTASRIVNALGQPYTVGVLVQANYGRRDGLSIAGVPIGRHMREHRVYTEDDPQANETGSIIIVVATDAPLLPHQLKRLAKRASLGLARMGSIAGNGSGDIFVAFGTGNPAGQTGLQQVQMLGNEHMDPLFAGVVQATEEAIVNAMIAARDMTGEGGHYAKAIPQAQLKQWLKHYQRLAPEFDLPVGITTYPDGRKPIEELYAAYLSLLEKGWQLDIIAQSQPQGRAYALPIIALRTPHGGKACWILSGIHGEEPAGPNAIAESMDAIAALAERQAVVLLPLNNPQGYANNWRYLNMQKYSADIEGQSVGDSSHLLIDPENPDHARAGAASSPEADAITRYILRLSALYPPAASIDLHEDNLISEGYVYSQGKLGSADPLALAAVRTLKQNGIPLKMSGETRFGEDINGAIIGPVIDGSIDELMSAGSIIVDGQAQAGPAAHTVLVFETPADQVSVQKRIGAHTALLKSIASCVPGEP